MMLSMTSSLTTIIVSCSTRAVMSSVRAFGSEGKLHPQQSIFKTQFLHFILQTGSVLSGEQCLYIESAACVIITKMTQKWALKIVCLWSPSGMTRPYWSLLEQNRAEARWVEVASPSIRWSSSGSTQLHRSFSSLLFKLIFQFCSN